MNAARILSEPSKISTSLVPLVALLFVVASLQGQAGEHAVPEAVE